MSEPTKDFVKALVIMAVVVILAFWLTRGDPAADQSCDATTTYSQGC